MNKIIKNKPRKILVATDFSKHSQVAILKAVELAKAMKADLTILHIAKKEFLEKMVEEAIPVMEKLLISPLEHATLLLKKQVEQLLKNKISIKYHIISGDHPAPKILKYAKDHKMDLLVLGSHGKYSVYDWFVGTTAEYIARKTQIPVLIIKKNSHKAYKKILVPIDFSESSKNTMQFAIQLFPKTNIHLLHVGDQHYEELLNNQENIPQKKVQALRKTILSSLKERAIRFIKKYNPQFLKFPCKIKLGYPGMVIIDEVKKSNQDLIIMGTEGHSQRHYLSMGRVASRVLIEIDRDILLVPPSKK